jgi:hypothetical protein
VKSKALLVFVAIAFGLAAAPVANAAKPISHKATHSHVKGKVGCKAEFMYMKGGKCMDARSKT